MTEEQYEQHLDMVDKLSLNQKYTKAFEYINENCSPLFEPVETDKLKQLVKDNALKFGVVLK